MVCLWDLPADSSPVDTTANIKGILEGQARYLESGTNGKVMADLNEIDEIPAEIPRPSKVFSLSSSCTGKDQDANALYQTQLYGFEIHNDFYRFCISEIKFSPLYPVSMFFDKGVLENSAGKLRRHSIKRGKIANQYIIQSDEDSIKCLSIVLSCRRVRFIIGRLRELYGGSRERQLRAALRPR